MACSNILPDEITAGLDFRASADLPDFPAPDWQLRSVIRGPMSINLAAIADGRSHVFSASAATTSEWTPGTYWFSIRAARIDSIVEVASGEIKILTDLDAITEPYDGSSQAEAALKAIDAVLARRATQDQQRYTINNRELWRTPIAELLKLRAYYAVLVSRERAKRNGRSGFGRPIYVKFNER